MQQRRSSAAKNKSVNKILKATCNPVFIAAQFTVARTWRQLKCPMTDEKMWYLYTMEYYTAIERVNDR